MINEKKKELLQWSVLTLLYFSWFVGLVGIRKEHIVLWILILLLRFFNDQSRKILADIGIWLVYWMVYDSLRIIPNWQVNTVHIKDLYDFDKAYFGVCSGAQQYVTLNEWCALHQQWYLDLLAGIFYISWVPLPILFAVWLYFKMPQLYRPFAWAFFIVNLIGFSIYYIFPAAPPWYVSEYGFGFNPNVMRSAAGLDRVDKLLNINLFHSIYTRNSNVFAAMPSLHSAYPLITFFFAYQTKRNWLIALFGVLSIGIWISAIYTNHHYVMDVVAGIMCASLGFIILNKLTKMEWFRQRFLARN